MYFGWLKRRSIRYAPVSNGSHIDDQLCNGQGQQRGRWHLLLAMLALLTVSGYLGYVVGRHSGPEYNSGLLAPAGAVERHFIYNRTYSAAPTDKTVEAWHELFPGDNGGFIHHPVLATNFSGIAVFHQLHCLHALYNLYYDSTKPEPKELDKRAAHHLNPAVHARHCFDYLRQSLMCQADTNLEPYDYRLDGVTGWVQKRCRDYDTVFRFANSFGGSKYAGEYNQ